jgi:hypothetical protein
MKAQITPIKAATILDFKTGSPEAVLIARKLGAIDAPGIAGIEKCHAIRINGNWFGELEPCFAGQYDEELKTGEIA